MIKRSNIFLVLCILSAAYAVAQNAYQLRRDWVIGSYSGMWKDSTDQTAWQPITISVDYSTNTLNPEHDSMVVVSFDNTEYYIWTDTTYLMYHNLADPNNGGKLYADSTFIYHYITPAMSGGHMIYFVGKLVQSYSGVNEMSESNMLIYPNPASDRIYLDRDSRKEAELTLLDIVGKQMGETIKSHSQRIEMNVNNLPQGIYFLTVKTKEGTLAKKIVVQK